jgi:hypothetical protein
LQPSPSIPTTPEPMETTPINVQQSLMPAPGVSFVTGPGTVYDTSSPFIGRAEQLVFENLSRFELILRDPGRTSTSIQSAIVELSSAQSRETYSLAWLQASVEGRKVIFDSLLRRLRDEAIALGGSSSGARPEASEDSSGSNTEEKHPQESSDNERLEVEGGV